MEKFQTYINKNRQGFDTMEPPLGHAERFERKLKARVPVRTVNVWLVASVAAVGGLLITASLSLMLNFSKINQTENNHFTSVYINAEVEEIELYYQHQLSLKKREVSKFITDDSNIFEGDVKQALIEMDEGYEGVRRDVYLNPNSEKALFALTLHYQTQLDILEGLLSKMQNIYSIKK